MADYEQVDIDDLRRRLGAAEAMLQAERQMFHAMAETLGDIVFSAWPDGSWDFVNARIGDITGLPVDAAVGNGWSKALHPDDLERVLRDLREAVASGIAFESSFRLRTSQGSYRRFVMQEHPLRDRAGRIARWIGTATDVNDLPMAEDALQQVRRQDREFLSKLVHDLRNAVAPIAYAAAILKMPAAAAAQKQEAVATIEGQVRELRTFLDNIPRASADTRKSPVKRDPSDSRLLALVPRRILLMVSDDDSAQDWTTLLRIFEHEVAIAHDVQEALQVAVAFRPDVLAVNFPLPAADGRDWVQRLRQQPGLEKAFIVAIQGDDGAQGRTDADASGCDAVLCQPFTLQDFLELIAAHGAAPSRRS